MQHAIPVARSGLPRWNEPNSAQELRQVIDSKAADPGAGEGNGWLMRALLRRVIARCVEDQVHECLRHF